MKGPGLVTDAAGGAGDTAPLHSTCLYVQDPGFDFQDKKTEATN